MHVSDILVPFLREEEGCPPYPYWPGGFSGITIGYGYDLGYQTVDQFETDWEPEGPTLRLVRCCGVRGIRCAALIKQVKAIPISADKAEDVLRGTIPLYEARAKKAFPGYVFLDVHAKAALCSLVYNRGTSMTGDRRREMRELRDAVSGLAGPDQEGSPYAEMAAIIRRMKRLWEGGSKLDDGLVARREREAQLVEQSALFHVKSFTS